MKKYYIAHFPKINREHWIVKFREKFDDKSHLVAPHITLFFPTEIDSPELFGKEVKRMTSNFRKFKIRFRSAMMMPENGPNGSLGFIFLVPDEGFGNVLRLHDLLYSERFAHLLRLDIPFVPHMTIGSNLSLSEAKKQVDALNSLNFDLEFTFNTLSIVEIADSTQDRIIASSIDLV